MESMLKMVGASMSNQNMAPTQSPSNAITSAAGGNISSADDELRHYVEEMLHVDKRFQGMSRYVFDINFYWSMMIPTACAGHGFIFFNPVWWDQLAPEERKTVIAHEIWHLILNHLVRGEDKDPEDYNIAGDYVINLACHDDGFTSTLSGAPTNFGGMGMLIDTRFRGMSTEQIYDIVRKERKKDPQNHKPAPGTPSKDQIEDLVKEALQGSGVDLQKQINTNAEAAEKALELGGQQCGTDAGGTDRVIQAERFFIRIKEATYDEIFEDFLIDPLSGGKRTHLRPSRRQHSQGLRLKGRFPKRGRKNRLTHLVYALDVSGSITAHQAQQFLTSAKSLKEKLNPVLMTVMLWDTKIVFEKVFREDEPLDKIHVRAGGGTMLEPVYKRVKEINPEALVIFTDLCVNIPPKPDWETIWFVPEKTCSTMHVTYGEVYLIPEK